MKTFYLFLLVICTDSLIAQNVGVGTTSPTGKLHILNNASNSNTEEPSLKIQNTHSGTQIRRALVIDNNATGTGEKKTVEIKTTATSVTSDVIGLKSFVAGGTTPINYSIWGQLTGQGAAIFGEATNDLGLAGRFDGTTYLNGKVGLKTDNPLSNLHVHDPEESLNTISITPKADGVSGGDSTALFFGEDRLGNRGMLYLYDGDNDELKLIGKNYNILTGSSFSEPYQTINRSSGAFLVNGISTFQKNIFVQSPTSLSGLSLKTNTMVAGNVSSSIILNNEFNEPTIRMYGNAGDNKGYLELQVGGSKTVEIDASFNSGGEIILSGPTKQVEIMSSPTTTKGGRIRLFNKAGTPRLVLDSEYGTDGLARIICDELEIKGGADLTEAFDINSELPIAAGMLVCVDQTNYGDLILCKEAGDKKVIGVVSGANGIRPGLRMSQEGSIADGEYPIAVTGRVYVKANLNNGIISPGDFITSSSLSGEAMKVDNLDNYRGAIVGKALSPIIDGFVLILISLQ